MIALQLCLALLTLVSNAFFVGAEFGMVSVRRSQIEPHAEQGNRAARTVLWGLEHVSALLATAQLGITLSTLVLGIVAEPAIVHLLAPVFHGLRVPDPLVHSIAFVLALALATYTHMLFGEMVPKNVALAAPVRTALLLGPPLVALARGLRPVVFSINTLANGLLRLLGVDPRDAVPATYSDNQLARLVSDSRAAGLLDQRSTERLRDALELGRRPVGAIVLSNERVVTARLGVTPEELEQLSADSGFSRFPVVDVQGRAVGYLHVKDALDAYPREVPFPLSSMRPVARVPAQMPLDDVLAAMRGSGTHLAAVFSADGRPAGLVTMADVLRELVGRASSG